MTHDLPQRLRTFYRALHVRIIFLSIIFLVVPIILYRLFQIADVQQNELLLHTVEQRGNLIASVLQPHLANFQNELPADLQHAMDGIVDPQSNIKLLVRPESATGPSAFLYVASAPLVSADYLNEERAQLVKLGIFDKLAPTCDGEISPSVRFTNPAGRPEILTSVTPLHLGQYCWVVITSEATKAILSSSIGQPAWRTPAIDIAALVYLLSAAIVAWLFVDIWRNIDRFRTAARRIRTQGVSEISFRDMNTIPELTGVADDFDALVKALKQSKDFIVQAAEENAHALKTPLAVIAQAIEPLKRAIPAANTSACRSLELIERSTARMDFLVSAARDLETATADVISANSRSIDLSAERSQLAAAYQTTLNAEGKHLKSEIDTDVRCYATEEAIESILENLLENAASFTTEGGAVTVILKNAGRYADLTVADDGPGVPPDQLPMIFNRNFSTRAQPREAANAASRGDSHYGLGLWIVRRNIESLGGRISACNREGRGFAVTVSFRTGG